MPAFFFAPENRKDLVPRSILLAPLLAMFLAGCSGVGVLNTLAVAPGVVRHAATYDEPSGQKLDIYEDATPAPGAPYRSETTRLQR